MNPPTPAPDNRPQPRDNRPQPPATRTRSPGTRPPTPGARSPSPDTRPPKPVSGYRDLEVWQKAMDLVVRCYELTKSFPDSERFGLVSQLRRAAVSVPSNIAEGHGRDGIREYLHHLSIAYGSLMEVETQVQIASRLTYCEDKTSESILTETQQLGRMLNGLKRALRSKLPP